MAASSPPTHLILRGTGLASPIAVPRNGPLVTAPREGRQSPRAVS
ncbi:hypothetical protein SAMN05421869_14453 [Nonomuraea jiangxiensis]|uniref:Uncharacterized protein n=1 Tax=Nonomuraea jiangxiensis TaxID=633440 RepID=A0A1G9TEH5_9ACTN|nr:hypothetical protein SAMN05421869_14453 [Nonomuraea jiangxiensis]